MYTNQKDQISLEEAYKRVHTEVVEEDFGSILHHITTMLTSGWNAIQTATPYSQLSPNDRIIMDTFWDYVKSLVALIAYFSLGFPVASGLIKMAQNFLEVKNKRSKSFSDYMKSLQDAVSVLTKYKQDSQYNPSQKEAGKHAAEQIIGKLKTKYDEAHMKDVEETGKGF
jgi:hypothetical protein